MSVAQPSSNREPTMEEILASIRRIIENSENGGATVHESNQVHASGNVQDNKNRKAPVQTPRLDEVATGSQPVSGAVSPGMVNGQGPLPSSGDESDGPDMPEHLKLATRQNEIGRGWLDSLSEAPDDAFEDEFGESDNNPAARLTAHTAETAFSLNDVSQKLHAASETRSLTMPGEATERPRSGTGVDETAISNGVHAVIADHEEAIPSQLPQSRTLMSAEKGAQVAASFDDLSHAIHSEARRSFDDIAEEMMRPMLQQWLDDNLPILVERLVREEIERIARGERT